MTHDRCGHRADVVKADVGTPFEEGAGLAAEDEALSGAGPGAPVDPLVDVGARVRLSGTGVGRELHRVAHHFLGDGDAAHDGVAFKEIRSGEDRLDLFGSGTRGLRDDRDLFVFAEVIDHDVEHESVELCLGQGIGALHLDRVLRREDKKRLVEDEALAGHGDLFFLHRLEQGGLRLGRGAVDLVGEDEIGENRAAVKDKLAASLGRLFEDLRPRDVRGHQVGSELDAVKREIKDLRERAHEQRLRESRRARDEAVAAGEQGDQHLVDDLVLPDDDLAQLFADDLAGRGKLSGHFLLQVRGWRGGNFGEGGVVAHIWISEGSGNRA